MNVNSTTSKSPDQTDTSTYAKCIDRSKKVRWDIDADVIRGRHLRADEKFLPDTISMADRLPFLDASARRLLSQVQGRTYANMFGLVERFINCKVLEISQNYGTGDQVALEALIRFSDEELKHQELFRRIDALTAEAMPEGYRFLPQPNEVARVVLAKSTWSVLALTFHIELFTQSHYRKSIAPEANVSPLFKDVFLYHWKEEAQHANLDEIEWRQEDARLTPEERDDAVNDLIELVLAVDGIVQIQAAADADYFIRTIDEDQNEAQRRELNRTILKAYRWQYVISGLEEPRFQKTLESFVDDTQMARIQAALQPVFQS